MGSLNFKIYRNNGDNSFTDIDFEFTGFQTCDASWGDYDNDGYLDILVSGCNNSYCSNTYYFEAKIYKNNGNDTFTAISSSLTGVRYCSLAWGDYNNDGKLDILLTGSRSTSVSKIYRNDGMISNTIPSIPLNLNSDFFENKITLKWNKASDNETSQDGLSYNVSIGTYPDTIDICSPMADISNGFRRIATMGNSQLDTSYLLNSNNLIVCQEYYYKVQAIDNSFAGSPFSVSSTFFVPLTVDAGDDLSITCGSAANISAISNYNGSGNLSYLWDPSAGLSATNIGNPIATPLVTTKYKVIVTSTDGCEATDSITVVVNNISVDAGNNQSVTCGSSTNLSVTTNYNGLGELSYTWSSSNGLDNSNIQNPTANPIETTTYYVTVTSSEGCEANDSITVFVNPIIIDTGNDKTITCGSSTNLSVSTNYNGSGVLNYFWVPVDGLNDANLQNPVANPLETTKYYLTVTSPEGCESIDSITVFVNPISLNAGNDKTITCSGSTNLTVTSNYAGSGILNYTWYPEVGLSSTSVHNPVASPLETTTYYVTATSTENCSAVDSVTVYVIPLTVNAGIDKTITCGGATIFLHQQIVLAVL